MTSASSKKVITDNYSSEEATSNIAKFKAVQVNDAQYEEKMAASAIKNTLEKDGVKAEKNAALLQVGDKELSQYRTHYTLKTKKQQRWALRCCSQSQTSHQCRWHPTPNDS